MRSSDPDDRPLGRGRVGRSHHLGEDARNRLGGRSVERTIDRDDAAKGGNAVAGERGFIGFDQRIGGGDAARLARAEWR